MGIKIAVDRRRQHLHPRARRGHRARAAIAAGSTSSSCIDLDAGRLEVVGGLAGRILRRDGFGGHAS